MTIHLLHPSTIEGKAISFLLNEKGHKVYFNKNSFEGDKSNLKHLFLIEANYLQQLDSADLNKLCKSTNPIVLLGKLNQLFLFFKFQCDSIGFVCKKESAQKLYAGLHKLKHQENFVSNKTQKFLRKDVLTKHQLLLTPKLKMYLTTTELETMLAIAKGQNTQQIANNWNRSYHTISNHRKNIIEKLYLKGTFSLNKFCALKRNEIQTLISIYQCENKVNSIIKNNQR